MGRYFLRRIIQSVPVLLLITIITFAIVHLLPGDPALAYLGEAAAKDQVAYEAVRLELGLDQPLPVQYGKWLGKVVQGDMGKSVRTREPVTTGLSIRLPVTLQLALMAILFAVVIAVPVGILSAVRPGSKTDSIGTVFAISGVAVPHFWLGIILIYVFALWLRWLPASGYKSPTENLGANLQYMLLPALTLGAGQAAVIMRQVRSSLIEVLRNEYVRTARAKGLRERMVVQRHALKNAFIPVITIIGMQVGRLFGGAVVVESIFALPGLGRLAIDSIMFRDFAMLQGAILILAVAVVVLNLLTDVLYAYLDPRIKYA